MGIYKDVDESNVERAHDSKCIDFEELIDDTQ